MSPEVSLYQIYVEVLPKQIDNILIQIEMKFMSAKMDCFPYEINDFFTTENTLNSEKIYIH